ncbi:MAG TPA: hypothetical protein VIG85_00430 [Comamonas sp.]|uniref:hypothetical protein n=1 Tax=Comamonas halotolerans TaxID=3041496 RepID=UPI0024E08AAA|nr:hypothetical protein [Comamonas sp. NoAH]
MNRGLLSLLENATTTLVLAVLVLGAGIGYGAYMRHQAPEPAAVTTPLSDTAAATPKQ